MERLKNRAANLVSVKSVVTIMVTVVFVILAMRGVIGGNDYMTVFLMILSFYFGTQSQKVQEAIDRKANGVTERGEDT